MTWDELVELAEGLGVRVIETDRLRGRAGLWESVRRIVWISCRPSAARRRAALAHELGHVICGHEGAQDEVGEAKADQVAAGLLISEREYVIAERLYDGSTLGIAQELDVPTWVVEVYRDVLARRKM